MALPVAFNPISLNEIHIEAGGTTGTTAALNDTDIRGLIGKTSGTANSFSEYHGVSNVSIVWAGDFINSLASSSNANGAIADHYFDNDGGTRRRTTSFLGSPITANDSNWASNHPNTTGADWEIRTGTVSTSGTATRTTLASNTTYNLGTQRINRLNDFIGTSSTTLPIIIRASGGSGGVSYNLVLNTEVSQ